MLELMLATTSSLLHGWSEAQIVLLVLAGMLVGVALLSYFVIAPEYEKRFEKQYAATVLETTQNYTKGNRSPMMRGNSSKQRLLIPMGSVKHRLQSTTPKADERRFPLEPQDMEAAFSDDEASSTDSEPIDAMRRSARASQADLSRRRKSESDALRQATVNRAEMLRRRVLLRKLEEEIDGAIQETNAKAGAPTPRKQRSMRLVRRDSLGFSEDRLRKVQEHSVDCVNELELLAKATDADTIKCVLHTLHDVLACYLSSEYRDLNKVTVFCNSLLKHDGLNHLRGLEIAEDAEIRSVAKQIIEKAVPVIWH